MLTLGKVRNAAEKAWRATKRTTDALYLARNGRAHLVRRYYTRQEQLHGECFYNRPCDPLDETERRIRKTSDYIDDAECLAEGETL